MRRILAGALIFLFLFTITGFFVAPPILKSYLVRTLSEKLHREVTIRKITLNPFLLSADIRGVVVTQRGNPGTFISVDELYLNLQTASVWKGGPILKEIKVDRPYINVIRNSDGTYNFSDLLKEEEPKPAAKSKPMKFSLNNIQIVNGSVDFLDGPKQTRHKVRDIVIKIPFVSNLPHFVDIYVQPLFEAKINGTPVSFKGRTKPFTDSLETAFDVNVKDFNVPYYLAYVPFKMNFKIPSGFIDTKIDISYIQHQTKAPTLGLTGDIDIKKVKVTDIKDTQMISLPLTSVSVVSSDLISQKVHLSRVLFQSPEINLSKDRSGKMNLEALIPHGAEEKKGTKETKNPAKEEKKDSKGPAIDVDGIKIAGGKVFFSDASKAAAFRTTLENIDLNIAHFSNSPDRKTAMELSLQTEAKETLKVAGDFSVAPMAAEGTVELKHVPIKKYAPYFSDAVLFDVEDAQLDFQTHYTFSKGEKEPEIRLSGMTADLTSLVLRKRGDKEAFLRIPSVSLRETGVDLAKKELVIGIISTQKGLLSVKRTADGRLNLENLVPPTPAQAGKETPEKVKKAEAEKPWQVQVKDLSLEGYTVKGEDLVPSEPVEMTVDRIRIKGKNISTAKNSRGRVSLSLVLNRKGTLSTSGTVTVNPPSGNLKLKAKDLDIVPFQPYFTDRVKIILTGAALSADGTLAVSYSKEGGPKVSYKGEASCTNFTSLDKANADDFLKWESLHFSGIDAGYNPLSVTIQEIALTDFYSRLIINQDGSLNVQGIVEEETPKTVAPAPADATVTAAGNTGAAPEADRANKVKIENITLQGGTINFSDRHIEPNYSANLVEMGGRVSGLSSEESTLGDIDLKGKLDNYAPLEITGKLNPLRKDLYVDLKVDFRDMDLSPVTPYSGRYVGYTIQKGKLSLNLRYLIVKKKLDSQNNIFLDQFTLGDKVDSPEATKLPVKLAIALLKNRKGEIKLDIPVTGRIDDPKFSVGRIVLKIIVNLLVKAATSPFALLGAIFGGGGEELSYIDFDYGSVAITPEGEKKIDKLVQALSDRPALKLEITGHVDVEKDKEGLRDLFFNRKLRAQKIKEMAKEGLPPVPVDEVKIGADEYPKYLKMTYKQERFPKPRNIIGIAKDLPPAEMEKLMLTHIEVKDDDLRQLASQRALAVKDQILKRKQVEPERIFLVEPKTLAPEKKEKMKDSRVDFMLK
ncbi:MAG: DUF748 domain-containing protein [Nitrospiraceae bacterium]|nr:DUF748 domain-containing protein [Nitrospiraceae bacterium]